MLDVWACFDQQAILASIPHQLHEPHHVYQPVNSRGKGGAAQEGAMAVFSIRGVMSKWGSDAPPFGTATVPLRRAIDDVATSPEFVGAVFQVDSPGGFVMGTRELHDSICRLAESKLTVAIVDGYCCSAALYAIAGVGHIVATPGSMVGSIGTISVIADYSEMFAKVGIKVHVIATSEIKGAGVFGSKLTETQLEALRDHVRAVHADFREAMTRGRKLTADQWQAVDGGRVWRAKRAEQLRLIDSVGYFRDSVLPSGIKVGRKVVFQMQSPPVQAVAVPRQLIDPHAEQREFSNLVNSLLND